MLNSNMPVSCLGNAQLLTSTRELLRQVCVVEADLIVHLGEIEQRKLFRDQAHSSMFAFCVDELGFSEDATWNRLEVARAARRFPAVIEALRSGQVHLTGLRVLAPRLTEDNHRQVLAEAAGKSKRKIEEIAARLAPKPDVPTSIRKTPAPAQTELVMSGCAQRRPAKRAVVAPLSPETYEIRFTGSRDLRNKLRQAQELLRHRIPSGDVAAIFEAALDVLIGKVKKERFGIGRKARKTDAPREGPATSRHIPVAVQREVYERDGGQCTFVDERGRRCQERGMLELDHVDGFARTRSHDPARIRLRCHAHNQHAAEQMYGTEFMDRAREARRSRPGAGHGASTAVGASPTAAMRLELTS
jgi:hypothetical protein